MGYIAAWLFLFIVLFFIIRIRLTYRLYIALFLTAFFSLFLYRFADMNKIKSLITPAAVLKQYHLYTDSACVKTDNFKLVGNIPVKLYLDNCGEKDKPAMQQETLTPEQQKRVVVKQEKIAIETVIKTAKYRSLSDAYASMVWRLIVWKDMLNELFRSRNIFGIDFGMPFRSISLEVLGSSNFGQQVGWIEPHNSYIHILYRSGIVGFLFIVAVWGLFIKMARLFIIRRNIKGILLSSALLSWLVFSHFAVVLELPYFAIPFWSLFGITLRSSGSSIARGDKESVR